VWAQPIGDNVNTVFQVWHGLGSRNVIVAVYRNSAPYDEVECDVERTDANSVTIRTLPYLPSLNEFILVVASGGAQATLNVAMDSWHTVGATGEPAFQNSWVNYDAATFASAGFRKDPGGRVAIRGSIKTGASGTIAFTLPTGYRPPKILRFSGMPQQGAAEWQQVNVNPSGDVAVYGSNPSGLVSLDGIEFDTESVNQVASIAAQAMDSWHFVGTPGEPAFENSWANYDTVRLVKFRKYPDGSVEITGIPRGGASGSAVFHLPVGYRPNYGGDLQFTNYCSGGVGTLAVLTDGTVAPANATAGSNVNTYVYMQARFDSGTVGAYTNGIFPYLPVTMDNWHAVGAAGEPGFQNGWQNLSGPPESPASFRKYPDGKVLLRGILNKGGANWIANETVFTLPVGYRPAYTSHYSVRVFATGTTENNGRIDIWTDGQIKLIEGATTNPVGWLNIEGIEFDVGDVRQVASSAAQPMDAVHMVGAAGEPPFANGWLNYDSSGLRNVRFRKDPFGKVRLAGLAKTGPSGSRIFTLPVGYRPLSAQPFLTIMSPGQAGAELDVAPDGAVTPYGGAVSTYVSLDGVEFDTESQSTYASAVVQINAPPRVTSLPVGPSDGQECYLAVDTAAAYGGPYLWHCRYNASLSGTSKWEVISGVALRIEGVGGRDWNTVGVPTRATTYAVLQDNLGPKIVVPAAGVYEMECKSTASMEAASSLAGMYLNVTGDAGVPWNAGDVVTVPAAAAHGNTMFGRRTRAIAAGATVEVYYASSNAGISARFYDRALYVRPIRIG
jgi:hypothetical protein